MPFDFLRREPPKSGLALDTTVSQVHGRIPEQIYPDHASNGTLPDRAQATGRAQALSERVKGLRPSPLDLASAISLSDRAIPIGLEVPSTSLSKHKQTSASSKCSQEPPTPSIIITPANDGFEHSVTKVIYRSSGYRPASSIYSRRVTSCTTQRDPPPVPPLPTFIHKHLPRESNVTIFEEDSGSPVSAIDRSEKRVSSVSEVPTPRRSRGWWNIITSPFSGTKSGAFFWRSPSIPEEDESDNLSILRHASPTGTRELGSRGIRSAPLSCTPKFHMPNLPKRSDTSPAALRTADSAFSVYDTPDRGEAAEYYRMGPDNGTSLERTGTQSTALGSGSEISSPFDDKHQISDARHQPQFGQAVFCSPSERELHGESPEMSAYHASARQSSYGIVESHFSPMTETPTIEAAHVEHFLGPGSTTDLRQIDIGAARSVSPAPGRGLGEATLAHRCEPEPSNPHMNTEIHTTHSSTGHARNDYNGLGISEPNSPKERSLSVSHTEPARLPEKSQFHTTAAAKPEPRSYTQDKQHSTPWYRRFVWIIFTILGLLLVLLVVLCVMFIPSRFQDIDVAARWVNTTAFPPLPTGVLTVAKAQTVEAQSGCVHPQALWSCTKASGLNPSVTTIDVRFVIRFQNGTLPANETQLGSNSNSSSPASRARSIVKRDFFSGSIYRAMPNPPSEDDQLFIGGTTDNNTGNVAGERTPFSISLISAASIAEMPQPRMRKRDDQYAFPLPDSSGTGEYSTSGKNASAAATDTIPKPALQSNGQPASPTLYPFVSAQPLRLYNRGEASEHYGFYTYFDKSIYVANLSAGALTDAMSTNIPLNDAKAVCSFSQSRFLVQIFTKKAEVTQLGNSSPPNHIPAVNSTANVMTGRGSFPYSVTITVDRHGGDASKKGVYCYALDGKQKVNDTDKMWISEDRAFGGSLVNPAIVPGGNFETSKLTSRASYGGIDGGTGGCTCAWQNW